MIVCGEKPGRPLTACWNYRHERISLLESMKDTDSLEAAEEDHGETPSSSPNAVNILRQRTFNEELRSLVGRITRHRDFPEKSIVPEIPESGPNELLRMLHRLSYRARNIPWRPLEEAADRSLDFSAAGGFDREMAVDTVNTVMRNLGCDGFAILSYDFSLKAFSVLVNTMKKADEADLFIGLHDTLVPLISASSQGINLSEASKYDSALHGYRLNRILNDRTGVNIYIVSLEPVFVRMLAHDSAGNPSAPVIRYPYPLFLTICPDGAAGTSLYNSIVRDVALPLYMLCRGFSADISISSDDTASLTMNKVEFIFRMCENSGLDRCVNIGIDKNSESMAENRMVLSYLFNRLRKEFGSMSVFLRFKSDHFTIIIRRDRLLSLERAVGEADSLCGGIFSTEVISLDGSCSINSILMRTLI
jgi:hypothetical protein